MQAVGYYIFYAFCWILGFLPIKMLYGLSDFLYLIIYKVVGYRQNIIRNNLRNSFPEKSENEINTIAKKFYKHFCDMIIEDIILFRLPLKKLAKYSKYTNPLVLNQLLEAGKPVVILSAHYGNWEYSSSIAGINSFEAMPIYKEVVNPYFDRFMYQIRSKFGARPVRMQDILRLMMKKASNKEVFCTGFIADQAPMDDESHFWTTFLNQDTAMFTGAERIAKKLDLPVIYLHIDKVKRGYYELTFYKLFDEPKKTKDFEITEKYTRLLEGLIKEKPEFWLWSHRRWKRKKPETLNQ